jgi:acetyl-CoA acetyltransferase
VDPKQLIGLAVVSRTVPSDKHLNDRAAVVGIAESPFMKNIGRSEADVAAETVLAALADAGVDPSAVDGYCSSDMETTLEVDLARNLGAGDIRFFTRVGYGGGGGCAMVGLAATAVATGLAEVVVVWRSRNRGSGERPWASQRQPPWTTWNRPYGLIRPVDEVAMVARRYLHDYGISREQLAAVALTQRAHAQGNPQALTNGRPMTLDDYLGVRMISEPLCLYDCSLETDGAVALVVTSVERAADCARPAVMVHAHAQGANAGYTQMTNLYVDNPLDGPPGVVAEQLWARSEIGPDSVDVAEFYDVFSPLVLMQLEDYGFCGPGEAPAMVAAGACSIDGGSLPVNTAGGSLSEAYIHGFNLLSEGVRQLRGTAVHQVAGAKTALVTSGGHCAPTSAVLLRR